MADDRALGGPDHGSQSLYAVPSLFWGKPWPNLTGRSAGEIQMSNGVKQDLNRHEMLKVIINVYFLLLQFLRKYTENSKNEVWRIKGCENQCWGIHLGSKRGLGYEKFFWYFHKTNDHFKRINISKKHTFKKEPERKNSLWDSIKWLVCKTDPGSLSKKVSLYYKCSDIHVTENQKNKRLKDRVWIHTDKLKYVMQMSYCVLWDFRGTEIIYAWKDYSKIVGFLLICYHRENQRAKGICKSTQLYNPEHSHPLFDNAFPSLHLKKNKRNAFPKL